MTPDKGKVIYENINLLNSHPSSRKNILYIGHAPAMYASLSALENLKFALEIRNNKTDELKIKYKLEEFGLSEQSNDPISFFSQGMLQRLKLTYAELSNWNLLLLDEPAVGLAPPVRLELLKIIRRLVEEENIGVILIEHAIEFVMTVSDTIMVLNNGEVIADGAPEEIRQDKEVLEAYLGR